MKIKSCSVIKDDSSTMHNGIMSLLTGRGPNVTYFSNDYECLAPYNHIGSLDNDILKTLSQHKSIKFCSRCRSESLK